VPRASLQVRHVDSKHSKPGREAASIIFANREIGYLRTHTLPEKHLTPPAVKGENVHRQNLVLVLEARPINVLDTLCTQTTISQDAKRRLNHFSSDASNTCALGASISGSTKCNIDQGSATGLSVCDCDCDCAHGACALAGASITPFEAFRRPFRVGSGVKNAHLSEKDPFARASRHFVQSMLARNATRHRRENRSSDRKQTTPTQMNTALRKHSGSSPCP